MEGALSGIRILDVSRVLAGPFCTMILGDLGAEVIKIEHHETGDETRGWGPPFLEGESAYYLCANRNKQSMTLNLKSEKGKEILKKLALKSDVLVQNFRTGTMERLGLGYDELKKDNRGLISASISGFGATGPYKNLPGYDFIIQGMSGLMSITGEKNGPPMKVGVAISDVLTGLYTCIGILSALQARNQTGRGQEIDISLLDCQVSALINVASNYLANGKIPERMGNEHPNIVPYQVFSAQDGEIVIAVGNDAQFQRFAKVLGRPELSEMEEFSQNEKRLEHRQKLVEICEEHLKLRTKKEWKVLLDKAGIPNGSINNMKEMFADPQIQARGMVQEIKHPLIDNLKVTGSPLNLSETPVKMERHPPLVGEHTEKLLSELGYSEEEIEIFKNNHII